MTTITGHDAIAHAAATGATLRKYADPVDGAREVTLDEARTIAAEDAGLVWCEAPADDSPAALDHSSAAQTRSPRAFAEARAALARIAARHGYPAEPRALGAHLRAVDAVAPADRDEAVALVHSWVADEACDLVISEVAEGYLHGE